jgi:hypothetical protein
MPLIETNNSVLTIGTVIIATLKLIIRRAVIFWWGTTLFTCHITRLLFLNWHTIIAAIVGIVANFHCIFDPIVDTKKYLIFKKIFSWVYMRVHVFNVVNAGLLSG